MKAALAQGQGKGVLHVVGADLHAAPAQNAFAVVTHVEVIVVFDGRVAALAAGETRGVRAIARAVGLNLRRLGAVHGRMKQFQDHLARALHARGVGVHLQSLDAGRDAGRDQGATAGRLHDAHAADCVGRQVGMIAQRGDVHANLGRGGQHGSARGYGQGVAVNHDANR